MGQGLHIHEVYRSQRRITVGRLLWTSDQPIAERRLPDKTQDSRRQTSRHPVGFELTISAGERPKTYASDGAATGTGNEDVNSPKFRYTTVGQSANDSHQSSLFLTHPTAIPATGHHVAGLKQT